MSTFSLLEVFVKVANVSVTFEGVENGLLRVFQRFCVLSRWQLCNGARKQLIESLNALDNQVIPDSETISLNYI